LVSDSNQPPTLKNGGDKVKQYCLNYQLVKKPGAAYGGEYAAEDEYIACNLIEI
jgi:hypothetical protein